MKYTATQKNLLEADSHARQAKHSGDQVRYLIWLLRSEQITDKDLELAAMLHNEYAVETLRAIDRIIPPIDDLEEYVPLDRLYNLLKRSVYLLDLPDEVRAGMPPTPDDNWDHSKLNQAMAKWFYNNYNPDWGISPEWEADSLYSLQLPEPMQVVNHLEYVMDRTKDFMQSDPGAGPGLGSYRGQIGTGLYHARKALGDEQFYFFMRQQLLPPELHYNA